MHHFIIICEFKLELWSGNTQSGSNSTIFSAVWPWNLTDDLEHLNKANLKDLIAATSLVISNWIQIVNFSTRVTVKCDGWPRKTIGHFYTTSSFVHHFKSIGEFKLDFQSRNAPFGSKLVISCVTLKFDGWRWKTKGHLFYATSSFLQHFVVIGEFKLELQSRNPQSGSNSTIFRAVWPCSLTDDLEKQ